MTNEKAKIKYGKYFTRKDWRNIGGMFTYYRKRWAKDIGHSAVRNYNGEISNGGMYKKLFDIPWTIL